MEKGYDSIESYPFFYTQTPRIVRKITNTIMGMAIIRPSTIIAEQIAIMVNDSASIVHSPLVVLVDVFQLNGTIYC